MSFPSNGGSYLKPAAVGLVLVLCLASGAWSRAGKLDASFSDDGKVVTDFHDAEQDEAEGVDVAGGKIVAAGTLQAPAFADWDIGVARYMSNGEPDNSFGGGSNEYDITGDIESATDVQVLENGKIIVVGYGGHITDFDFYVARLLENGPLDTNFGTDSGKTITPFGIAGDHQVAYALAITPTGKIILAGYSESGGEQNTAVVRYTRGGELDDSFSGNGIKVFSIAAEADAARDVVLQPNGKIVVAGWARQDDGDDYDFGLARLTAGGKLDKGFSNDGHLVRAFSKNMDDEAWGVGLTENRRIVAGGEANSPNGEDFAFMQFRRDGTLDKSFGKDGRKRVKVADNQSDAVQALVIDGAGRIVASGYVSGNPQRFALVRLKPGGRLDKSFSGDGIVTTGFGGHARSFDVTLQGNGRIVATGWAETSVGIESSNDFALARYLNN